MTDPSPLSMEAMMKAFEEEKRGVKQPSQKSGYQPFQMSSSPDKFLANTMKDKCPAATPAYKDSAEGNMVIKEFPGNYPQLTCGQANDLAHKIYDAAAGNAELPDLSKLGPAQLGTLSIMTSQIIQNDYNNAMNALTDTTPFGPVRNPRYADEVAAKVREREAMEGKRFLSGGLTHEDENSLKLKADGGASRVQEEFASGRVENAITAHINARHEAIKMEREQNPTWDNSPKPP